MIYKYVYSFILSVHECLSYYYDNYHLYIFINTQILLTLVVKGQ